MNVASYIDHTSLKPTILVSDVTRLCNEARDYGFAAVCIPPSYIQNARQQLKGCNVKVATVISFPFGYAATSAKINEVMNALETGADELDAVINISDVKNNLWKRVEIEVEQMLKPVHENGKIIKVIIESGVLTDQEIIACCKILSEKGVDFVKTSTGYAETGATLHAVQLMRANLSSDIRIKASGGIKTYESAIQYIKAGASRIGCSAGVSIIKQQSDQWVN